MRPYGRVRTGAGWCGGFTLIELLAVAAIVGLLVALLFPVLRGAQLNGQRTTCASNLRQVHVLCTLWASEHDGNLPVSFSGNPSQFISSDGKALDAFMKANGVVPDVWFCPGITRKTPNRLPALWGKPNFVLGYFYLGNPSAGDDLSGKYVEAPYPSPKLSPGSLLAVDFCAGQRPAPTSATGVQVWVYAPHFDRLNRLLGDGSVKQTTVGQMTLGFEFAAPVNVYW